ncbi:MAG: V-type ATP synthase subunit I [Treponema sp.]|nr:V-type ATP synthase subunit I [Treponema sp.]
MIVPMKKVSLVIQNRDQDAALARLREAGVLHLEKRNVSSDALSRALERKARGDNAIALIKPYKAPKKKPALQPADRPVRRESDLVDPEREPYSLDALNAVGRPDLIDLLVNWGKDKKGLEDRLVFLGRERKRIEKWGSFDPRALKELAESGVAFYLYEIPVSAFAGLKADPAALGDIPYILMGGDKNAVYLLTLGREIPGLAPLSLPEKSLAEIDKEAAELPVQIEAMEKRLASFADRMPALKRDMAEIQGDIDFESARSSLEQIDGVPGEYALSWITGYAPQEDVGLVKRAAAENNWALIADDPGPDDEVPTKLKNNRLVSLLYPITDFLETVPGYHEVDISGWFLLFFCLFFGMIFGDAAYGLILMLIAVFGIAKTAKKGVPAALKMMLLLSTSNVLWGVLTCTWFGIPPEKLPAFFRNISLSLISGANPDQDYVSQNLQVFCFSLALLQLSIAHLKSIMRNIRSLKIFGELGSLAMLWGIYFVVLYLVVSSTRFPFLEGRPLNVVLGLVIGGFALSFIFSSYEGSVIQSVLTSLKNIISVVLGVANIFSDIMSYIRLWAVGLAGASISATVNAMAGPLLGNFLMFLGVILLVFGHGLNIVLNVLSVLVHGVRLNTLEFSGHLGLTWSGTAYKPFAKTGKK